jgi:hypothetical protein
VKSNRPAPTDAEVMKAIAWFEWAREKHPEWFRWDMCTFVGSNDIFVVEVLGQDEEHNDIHGEEVGPFKTYAAAKAEMDRRNGGSVEQRMAWTTHETGAIQ